MKEVFENMDNLINEFYDTVEFSDPDDIIDDIFRVSKEREELKRRIESAIRFIGERTEDEDFDYVRFSADEIVELIRILRGD